MKWTNEERVRAKKLYEADSERTYDDVAGMMGAPSGESVRKAISRIDEEVKTMAGTPEVNKDMFPDFDDPEDVGWREWCDTFDSINEKHRAIDPIQEKITVDLSGRDGPIGVAFFGDIHAGGGYTDHKAFMEMMEYIISTDGLYVALLGDTIEGFIPGVKTAETSDQMAGSLKSQFNFFSDLVHELADRDKLISVSWGDHDAKWIENQLGFNVLKTNVHDRAPYFTGRGLVRMLVGDSRYFMLVNHSERFASQWSDTHAARRAHERFFPADIVATAHKHTPEWRTFWHYQEMEQAGLELGGKAILIQTGTSKTGPDPYSIRSFNRGVFRVPTTVMWSDERQKEVVESPRMAKALMDGLK